jgi:hypothetical protein
MGVYCRIGGGHPVPKAAYPVHAIQNYMFDNGVAWCSGRCTLSDSWTKCGCLDMVVLYMIALRFLVCW